ncbi:MAG TPA: CheR family methyltransferase [Polyangiales bacterium]|nr:CheR family methyltransferase [Polyangiales bacterium]
MHTHEARSPSTAFPIVGVGASAGGLAAFTELLKALPAQNELAFVFIHHLEPTHDLWVEALARATVMPVTEAVAGTRVEPNHVYVIRPNTNLGIQAGAFTLSPRSAEGVRFHLPIDFLLRSLATDRSNRAIGVVLSGTASDGIDGLRAIRAEGGITFAQDPASARFPTLPRSAVEANVVDYCLPLTELAQELVRLSKHEYLLGPLELGARDIELRNEILAQLRKQAGVDLSEYKLSTIERRLARRMALRGVTNLASYRRLLLADAAEFISLREDIFVHVTAFFRDPEVFAFLSKQVFPEILARKAASAPVRIWVAGCSTGEEVYSLAMLFLERSSELGSETSLQIFGSDISEQSIARARLGVYSDDVMRDVSEERRKRHFTRGQGFYRVSKHVRELCAFVRHDLAKDPPLSKVDLVSCRNVMIYFAPSLQRKLVPALHYALNQPGYLVLGRNESISSFAALFGTVDKTNRVFARLAAPGVLRFAPRTNVRTSAGRPLADSLQLPSNKRVSLARHLDRLLLARYCPPGVIINERLDVLYFYGQTGAYLESAPGQPQHNLINMARKGLVSALQTTIARAKHELGPVRERAVELGRGSRPARCDVVVLPLVGLLNASERLFAVLFEEAELIAHQPPRLVPGDATEDERTREERWRSKLENELMSTRQHMHSLIEEHERANSELGLANEELVSGNEELKGRNEELETAKEDLQASNEELTTLNDELQDRNLEVSQVNTDLVNLFATVDIPILILDKAGRIRRFTPKAHQVLHVLDSDVGRPIADLRPDIELPGLEKSIANVVQTGAMEEREARDASGHWYRVQLRPYTAGAEIDGVMVSFVDIDALKRLVSEADASRAEAERINRMKDDFLATLSHELRTPLSTVLLYAQALRTGELDEATRERAFEAIERGTRAQVELINDLLDVSRIVAGRLVLSVQQVDFCDAVRTVLSDLQPAIGAKSLEVLVELDPEIGMIEADPARVRQIITNLFDNAIKFTPARGRVSVLGQLVEHGVSLSIKDSGIGVEPAFLSKVFDRFTQQDASNTRRYGGLGLGLAIVRHLVELHSGHVRAASEGLGRGATFSFDLPRKAAAATPST